VTISLKRSRVSGPFLLLELRGTIWGGLFVWSHLWLLYCTRQQCTCVPVCVCLACVAGRSFNTWTTKVLLPGQLDSVCLYVYNTVQVCRPCLWSGRLYKLSVVRQQGCSTKVFGECVWPVLRPVEACLDVVLQLCWAVVEAMLRSVLTSFYSCLEL